MRVFHIFIILVILKLANAKLLKSVFLASFDPLSIDNETEEKFDDDDTVDVADDDEVHGNKSKITMDSHGGKIEFVSPLSTEDSEIQRLGKF
ncbi:hypothetical protein FG379_003576 [Cryptosporidium bovis]|uniref:uncharacterized protein n=1 Tax=Cryptosporidium bovis TaxID=310047 RepID=UPI00351A4613|nr:hypothetical protein FG379_003576 [Cryptosporidium bovis]